jgi:hypothetical protein
MSNGARNVSPNPPSVPAVPSPDKAQSMRGTAGAAQAVGAKGVARESGAVTGESRRRPVGGLCVRMCLFLDEGAAGAPDVVVVPNAGADVSRGRKCRSLHGCGGSAGDGGERPAKTGTATVKGASAEAGVVRPARRELFWGRSWSHPPGPSPCHTAETTARPPR